MNEFEVIDSKVLVIQKEKKLFYRKGIVWLENENSEVFRFRINRSFFACFRFFERLLRLEPRLGFSLNDELFFSHKGFIYRVDESVKSIVKVCAFRKGMNNPLSICKKMVDDKELVYFGDYWPNRKREKCNIYCFDGRHLSYLNGIDGIKHIHSISFDEYRNCFYILSGDSDSESGIFISDESFSKIQPLFCGSKKYRACSLLPNFEGFLYATDDPSSPNYLKTIAFDGEKYFEPINTFQLPGPCIFGEKIDNLFFFSTSVEPDPEQNLIKYWFSQKTGSGNIDRFSYLYMFRNNQPIELFRFKKDSLNMCFLGFGNNQIVCSYEKKLFVYCSAVKKYDGKTLVFDLKDFLN